MSLRRRLARLEEEPIPRRETPEQLHDRMMKTIQTKLHLPLPELSSPEEHALALKLFQVAIARTKADRNDTAGLDELQEYALRLHAKYGTEPYWGQPD